MTVVVAAATASSTTRITGQGFVSPASDAAPVVEVVDGVRDGVAAATELETVVPPPDGVGGTDVGEAVVGPAEVGRVVVGRVVVGPAVVGGAAVGAREVREGEGDLVGPTVVSVALGCALLGSTVPVRLDVGRAGSDRVADGRDGWVAVDVRLGRALTLGPFASPPPPPQAAVEATSSAAARHKAWPCRRRRRTSRPGAFEITLCTLRCRRPPRIARRG